MPHDVKADEVVVEVQRVLDVSDVEMDMAHLGARRHRLVQQVVRAQVTEQLLEVDRVAPRASVALLVIGDEGSVGEPHRAVLGRLGVDLDPVAVRIPQVVRLGHHVVGRVLLPAQARQPPDHPGQLAAIGDHDREVVQA